MWKRIAPAIHSSHSSRGCGDHHGFLNKSRSNSWRLMGGKANIALRRRTLLKIERARRRGNLAIVATRRRPVGENFSQAQPAVLRF
jgi:hypothetical protein